MTASASAWNIWPLLPDGLGGSFLFLHVGLRHGSASRKGARLSNAWTRLRQGLAQNGVRKTVHGIACKLDDLWFDLRHGTDTAGRVVLDALEIRSDNKSRGVNYTPTHASAFRGLIGALSLPSDSVLVDLGCGKGKILLLACQYRFKRIVGVEFSGELCAVARRNVALFKQRAALASDIEIIEHDAADYAIANDDNVIFMFNPFDAVVLGQVMKNILASLERRDRRIWIVYNYPVCRDVILESGVFVESGTYEHGSSRFSVYGNRSDAAENAAASRLEAAVGVRRPRPRPMDSSRELAMLPACLASILVRGRCSGIVTRQGWMRRPPAV
ncbi:MAG TPA: methyltransferase domain-containing protein [Planctomycetota bacterium]|nr:methyltransferase domain-containing protein [Planctomycetota bacterium]